MCEGTDNILKKTKTGNIMKIHPGDRKHAGVKRIKICLETAFRFHLIVYQLSVKYEIFLHQMP